MMMAKTKKSPKEKSEKPIEYQRFEEVARTILTAPKAQVDEVVRKAKAQRRAERSAKRKQED